MAPESASGQRAQQHALAVAQAASTQCRRRHAFTTADLPQLGRPSAARTLTAVSSARISVDPATHELRVRPMGKRIVIFAALCDKLFCLDLKTIFNLIY